MNKKPSEKITVVLNPLKNIWVMLGYVLLVELWLVYNIPDHVLGSSPLLASITQFFERFVPVLSRITAETAPRPEMVRCYIVIVLLIMPFKIWLFWRWLNGNRDGVYRFLVISPLTDEKPAEGDTFMMDPLRQERGQLVKNKPRSWISRFIWSTLILLFSFGCVVVLIAFGSPSSASPGRRGFFNELVSGGYNLWSQTSMQGTFTAFLVAVSLCILRDYGVFFRRIINSIGGRGYE